MSTETNQNTIGVNIFDLIGPFNSSSKANSYVLMCICHMTNYPNTIPIPNNTAETVVQAYLQ